MLKIDQVSVTEEYTYDADYHINGGDPVSVVVPLPEGAQALGSGWNWEVTSGGLAGMQFYVSKNGPSADGTSWEFLFFPGAYGTLAEIPGSTVSVTLTVSYMQIS